VALNHPSISRKRRIRGESIAEIRSSIDTRTGALLRGSARLDYPSLVKLSLVEGRFFDRDDEERHALVCVIGDQVRRDLFGFGPALRRRSTSWW
jgi:hypothetical protein